ncbi:hypothetical protein ACZ11_12045 [Lysinibacillus xylanilyticus]|uniref:Uncharacterized protein n=1 Tax=Lysinibacillus xylanilyticus TaxID=582475 RepID=A0A0K9FEX1_9BACI|nr:hypothetical protein ACZ11_12045 [Lysinibacillus xylanilyticus]
MLISPHYDFSIIIHEDTYSLDINDLILAPHQMLGVLHYVKFHYDKESILLCVGAPQQIVWNLYIQLKNKKAVGIPQLLHYKACVKSIVKKTSST